ncbi:MAG: hypothetical protein COU35_00755 [Candidatus Magasanikbacteria bacterium CG10_big_fil_rev_8_21_14_0_10_47_10]|uniref:Uncharacterized protein n=1 Tax=Candidatus Magasanikbacteria bacterium CG10_big_fil_rev_8_21_14_0_10_47_10 TaxID=1974652 RepID=A0A2H0TRG2_9BACT|nr:MAG: hypothetical protein COU35_00755 [Candidatus Magasanikbacteria bacterium CG10_big_fil_rev_8_21_14_0_10_47_10]
MWWPRWPHDFGAGAPQKEGKMKKKESGPVAPPHTVDDLRRVAQFLLVPERLGKTLEQCLDEPTIRAKLVQHWLNGIYNAERLVELTCLEQALRFEYRRRVRGEAWVLSYGGGAYEVTSTDVLVESDAGDQPSRWPNDRQVVAEIAPIARDMLGRSGTTLNLIVCLTDRPVMKQLVALWNHQLEVIEAILPALDLLGCGVTPQSAVISGWRVLLVTAPPPDQFSDEISEEVDEDAVLPLPPSCTPPPIRLS